MITARELVFYIRAEDQASRVVKNAAKSFRSLSNIKSLTNQATLQEVIGNQNIAKASLQIAQNNERILRAKAAAQKIDRVTVGGTKPLPGYNIQETSLLTAASDTKLGNLSDLNDILATNLELVTDHAEKTKSALANLISQAEVERTRGYIDAIQGVARSARLLAVGVGAAFAIAAHSAAQFSQQVALAATQARPIGSGAGTTANIATRLQKQVTNLMQQLPTSSSDLANSFYQIFSGTNIQSIPKATQYVKLFSKAAVAGGASIDEMTQAGISIKNVFGVGGGPTDEFKNMTQALNVFFSAVRYGRMTAAQFANALAYITPVAKDVHLSFKNIAQDMAFFTRQTGGNLTNQDAQGLSRLIQLLGRTDVAAGLAKKGIQVFGDNGKGAMRPVVDIIDEIHKKLNLTPKETVNFFKTISAAGSGKGGTQGTIQAIRIFAQGIQNAKAYSQVTKNVNADNNEFIRSFQALSKNPGVQWQIFINQMKAFVIIIGTAAIPAIASLGKYVQKLILWFDGLSQSTKDTIAKWGVYGSIFVAFAATLTIVIGAVSKFILTLRLMGLQKLATDAGDARASFALFGGALAAALFILIKYPHQTMAVINALGGLKNVLTVVGIALTAIKVNKILQATSAVQGLGKATETLQVVQNRNALGQFASGFTTVSVEAEQATKEVTLLGKALLFIKAIGPLAIVIGVTETLTHIGQIQKGVGSWMDKHGLGDFSGDKNKMSISDVFNNASKGGITGSVAKKAQAQLINQVTSIIKTVGPQVASLKLAAKSGDQDAIQALQQYYKARALYKTYLGSSPTNETVPKRTDQAIRAAKAFQQAVSTSTTKATAAVKKHAATWDELWQKVVRADKAAQATPSIANNKALIQAENALQAASTPAKYQAATEYLSYLESTWTKTAKAAATAAKAVDTGSLSQLNSRLQQVVKLRTAYEKAPSIANHAAYFAALTKLNADYASDSSQDYINDYLNKVDSATAKSLKHRTELMKQNITNAKSLIGNLTQSIQSMYDDILSQNQSAFGSLFGGPFSQSPRQQFIASLGFAPRGKDELTDLQSQVHQYTQFNKQLDSLKKKGASAALITQLQAAGPGPQVTALAKAPKSVIQAYIKEFNKGQALIKSNTMTQLNSQLATYEKFGKKIARAIITGVQSQDQHMSKVLTNTILTLFPGLAKQAHLAPSRLSIPGAIGGNITNFHIYGEPTAKTKTAARHAAFRARNN